MSEVAEHRGLEPMTYVRTPVKRTLQDTPVLFYDDEDIVPAPRPVRASMGCAFIDALHGAGSARERHRLVRGMLADMGFDWLGYGGMNVKAGRCEPTSFFTPFAHPLWTQRYFGQRHHDVDPRQLDAASTSLPLVWDIADMDQRAASGGAARRFADQLCSTGIGSGVFLSMPSAMRADERVVISLMSRVPRRDWIGEGVVGQALVLALSLHEFLTRSLQPPPVTPPPRSDITATQRDILNCLMEGHSDKVIAHRLQMSSHAVDYHMRQLRRRFSARNRVQLVHAATDRTPA